MVVTQEQLLTRWISKKGGPVRVIAITSGKGGVGKTHITLNLAIRLARKGYRVLVLDGDLGLGNVDVMVGMTVGKTVGEVLFDGTALDEVIQDGPGGIRIIPAGSGISELTQLGEEGQLQLLQSVSELDPAPDYLILDTAAGIGPNVRFLAGCAQEIVVVSTPEPPAITDAYALMKVLTHQHGEKRFRLLVNMAKNARDAMEVYRRLSLAADRFLNASIDYVGYIPKDAAIADAIRRQRTLADADSPDAAKAFANFAQKVESWRTQLPLKGRLQFFFNREAGSTVPVA